MTANSIQITRWAWMNQCMDYEDDCTEQSSSFCHFCNRAFCPIHIFYCMASHGDLVCERQSSKETSRNNTPSEENLQKLPVFTQTVNPNDPVIQDRITGLWELSGFGHIELPKTTVSNRGHRFLGSVRFQDDDLPVLKLRPEGRWLTVVHELAHLLAPLLDCRPHEFLNPHGGSFNFALRHLIELDAGEEPSRIFEEACRRWGFTLHHSPSPKPCWIDTVHEEWVEAERENELWRLYQRKVD